MAVPNELAHGKEHHLSKFRGLNLSALANKLANTPQTLNLIFCDYLMQKPAAEIKESNSHLGQ